MKFKNDIEYYKYISIVIFLGFFISCLSILLMNIDGVERYFQSFLSARKLFVIQLFFWSMLGATVACYKFMQQDKEINESESLKDDPDPQILRYPNIFDVLLYAKRILFSGVLGIIASLILFAGLGYFEISSTKLTMKHKLFFVIFCFLVGLYQNDFLNFLSTLNKRFLQRMSDNKKLDKVSPKNNQ